MRSHQFGMYQIMPFTPTRKTLKTKAFTGVDKFLSHLHQLSDPKKEIFMDNSDAKNVWTYVNGFKVPALTKDDLDAWTCVVADLSFDQFQTAQRVAMTRPTDELRYRPSVQQFRGYALAPKGLRVPDHVPTAYDMPTAHGAALAAEFFDKWRHIKRKRKPERKIRLNAEIDAAEAAEAVA